MALNGRARERKNEALIVMSQAPLFDAGRSQRIEKRGPFEGPKPLSTRECADYIGQDLDYIYALIKEGVLDAEKLVRPGKKRCKYVIQQEDWIACLKKLNWSRIPKIG